MVNNTIASSVLFLVSPHWDGRNTSTFARFYSKRREVSEDVYQSRTSDQARHDIAENVGIFFSSRFARDLYPLAGQRGKLVIAERGAIEIRTFRVAGYRPGSVSGNRRYYCPIALLYP